MNAEDAALLIWMVATFAIGTFAFSTLSGIALSGATTWGLWALLKFREVEHNKAVN
ncbi:hypothetical protein ABNG03_05630 [Halorubrum sp. RMP-47]|uniref:hypothetical protein n=1 Tax=Halorubrum miltondacostae TaxID=3076378 RepID=UPI003528314A